MEKITERIKSQSKHFKNAGAVSYVISPTKERPLSFTMQGEEKQTPEGRFFSVREKTMTICKPLYVEDFVPKFGSFKSIKWHLVHTTWLLEKFVLKKFQKKYRVFHEKFDAFFESIEDLDASSVFSRPSLDTIIAYRKHVDEQIKEVLLFKHSAKKEEILYYLFFILALEMDSQEEILTQIKARFFESELSPSYWQIDEESNLKSRSNLSPLKWIEFSGGLVNSGFSGKEFAFDIEMPRHTSFINPFAMAQRSVTNGDFLQFVEEGGYERGGLWLADGWKYTQKNQKSLPKYWKRSGSKMLQYTLSGWKPLRLNEPVSHVSFFEADAYARYAKARLPSEVEWEVASESLSSLKGNFLMDGNFHPQAIIDEDLKMSGKVKGLFGNVWEWTTSLFSPYSGFVAAEPKLWKYTGRLEGNKRVLKGGSCLYDGAFFRPSFRKPLSIERDEFCTGIRLVKSL